MTYSTYQDAIFQTSADTLEYVIKRGDEYIFRGIAVKAPGEEYAYINVGDICSQYLSNQMPDFTDFDKVVTKNNAAFQQFVLFSVNHTIIYTGPETYMDDVTEQAEEIYNFAFDWDYEGTESEFMTISEPVNGRLDCRMKLLYSEFNERERFSFYVTPLLSAPYSGATLNAKIVTNLPDPSKLTATLEGPEAYYVSIDALSLTGATFITSINFFEPIEVIVNYYYDGQYVGKTTIIIGGEQVEANGIPLTFMALQDNTVYETNVLEYRVNNGPWTNNSGQNTLSGITFRKGDIVQLRGGESGRHAACASGSCEVFGNILSVYYPTDFATKAGVEGYTEWFRQFFGYFSSPYLGRIISAKNLILPPTTAKGCYYQMFRQQTDLKVGPKLPAEVMSEDCYFEMFRYCVSLEEAPELPATVLGKTCYMSMFHDCVNLRTVPPILQATHVPYAAYHRMFENCKSITDPPIISAETFGVLGSGNTLVAEQGSNCDRMFCGCENLRTIPELSSTALTVACYKQMFWGCASLTGTPVLNAVTLKNDCYREMFYGTAVSGDVELPADIYKERAYLDMFTLTYVTALHVYLTSTNASGNITITEGSLDGIGTVYCKNMALPIICTDKYGDSWLKVQF